uniref:Putative ovule protein n=1 Tax=Solanum chacoense TaxID=4108 RepID=A0A0V0HJ70_SOLCH
MVLFKDHIVNLLLGCSLLETMESSRFKDFSLFEIRSLKLKRNLISYNDDQEIEIISWKLLSPTLHSLFRDFRKSSCF